MPRGQRREIVYTGKAAKINERIIKLEAELKAAKEERAAAVKEQLKAEKIAAAKQKKEEAAAAKKALREKKTQLLKAIEESGKTPDEILEMLTNQQTSQE